LQGGKNIAGASLAEQVTVLNGVRAGGLYRLMGQQQQFMKR